MSADRYPPISDYALLSDCHSTALVSRSASIDWCCMPRLDAPSIFGRLLDWDRGGSCQISVAGDGPRTERRYLDRTMVLETTLSTAEGSVRVTDCLAMTEGGASDPRRQIIRLVYCIEGPVTVDAAVAIRFDYGGIRPWLRRSGDGRFAALGGSEGLVVWSDLPLEIVDRHDLVASAELVAGDRRVLTMVFCEPEDIDREVRIDGLDRQTTEAFVDETVGWWRAWCGRRDGDASLHPQVLRSALVLKALTSAPTGAIAAAATTSLPEHEGGDRNWDYRFSWLRDSWLTVRSLADIGFYAEADGFRRFVERSAAGNADELQLLYGLDGAHRLPELIVGELEGYRRSAPVRIGNAAQLQFQLDTYGYLLELAWQWQQRGRSPVKPYWSFIADVVDLVCERWREPDQGIWELRVEAAHHVHSKVLCWVAVDRAVRLAERGVLGSTADAGRWGQTRDEIAQAVLDRGVDPRRGCFVQSFGSAEVDAALLLLPAVGFVDHRHPTMEATVDAVIADLDDGGLIRRYRTPDGLTGTEGVFVACTFWLVECLAGLGRWDEADAYFQAACGTGNDLGLFAEQHDPATGSQLGNFPQGLSHLAHIGAARALGRHRPGEQPDRPAGQQAGSANRP